MRAHNAIGVRAHTPFFIPGREISTRPYSLVTVKPLTIYCLYKSRILSTIYSLYIIYAIIGYVIKPGTEFIFYISATIGIKIIRLLFNYTTYKNSNLVCPNWNCILVFCRLSTGECIICWRVGIYSSIQIIESGASFKLFLGGAKFFFYFQCHRTIEKLEKTTLYM